MKCNASEHACFEMLQKMYVTVGTPLLLSRNIWIRIMEILFAAFSALRSCSLRTSLYKRVMQIDFYIRYVESEFKKQSNSSSMLLPLELLCKTKYLFREHNYSLSVCYHQNSYKGCRIKLYSKKHMIESHSMLHNLALHVS